jgi:hypothetical protein
MQCSGHLPNGSSEAVYGDDDELVAFAEPAHAFRPGRSVATGASGCGVGSAKGVARARTSGSAGLVAITLGHAAIMAI